MDGWKHWLSAAGFFGFGTYELFTDGSLWLAGLCVVASGFLFYRALTDQTGAAVEDLALAVRFVRDPKGTLVGQAVDLLGGCDEQRQDDNEPGLIQSMVAEFGLDGSANDEKPAFDPDAVIIRYLANRPDGLEPEPLRRAVQGSGRRRA